MAAPDKTEDILDVNRRYHDVAAADYDVKWGVNFGEIGRTQVLGKVEKLLGRNPGPFARSLEIGSGTGYFSLNLLQAGVVRSAVCTDVSPGMLSTLRANADRLGLAVETATCDAAAPPFADEEFDLVLGHAVLHHLPELDHAFAEFRRVLKPGGVLLFAGEPSRHGDRIARVPKRAGLAVAPLWRRLVGAGAAAQGHGDANGQPDDHALEAVVDVLRLHARRARAPRRRGGLRRRPRPPGGAAGQLVRLVQPHRRGDRPSRGDPARLVRVRRPRLHRAGESLTPRCWSCSCRRRASTT